MDSNANRPIGNYIGGYGTVAPYAGAYRPNSQVMRTAVRVQSVVHGAAKRLPGIRAALEATGLKSGGTISFHHHLRNGDAVLNLVLAETAALGLRDLTVAASSLFPVHAPLVGHIRSGVVARILTAYMVGPVADAVSDGLLAGSRDRIRPTAHRRRFHRSARSRPLRQHQWRSGSRCV